MSNKNRNKAVETIDEAKVVTKEVKNVDEPKEGVPAEEIVKKPGLIKRGWNFVKAHKKVVIGTIVGIGAMVGVGLKIASGNNSESIEDPLDRVDGDTAMQNLLEVHDGDSKVAALIDKAAEIVGGDKETTEE